MLNFEIFAEPSSWVALITLSALEIVLGIDNIVFISILTGRLPADQQARARSLGLFLAMFMRIGLLFAITWVMSLTNTLFVVLEQEISGRDLILGLGGLFLVGKATLEIFEEMEGENEPDPAKSGKRFASVIVQILLLDIVFSLDSVVTAVGMADELLIMVIAVVLAVGVMLAFSGPISDFIHDHPSMKVLALSFLILIGVMLIVESLEQHVDKGYIYFAMAFALAVELVNMRLRKARTA